MKKRLSFLVFCVLLSFPMVCFAEELGGGYSLVPSENWIIKSPPASKYKVVLTDPADNFAPNINVVEEEFSGSMEDYIRLSMETLVKMMMAKKISESSFSSKNADGVRLVTHTQMNALKLRQVFYFFENSQGQKVVVTASTSRDSGDKFDAAFDKMLHSFRVK